MNYRKPWFLKRLKLLGEVFAINIPAYAVMSNHYHLVLYIDKARSDVRSTDEVITQWLRIFKGPELVHRYVAGECLDDEQLTVLRQLAEIWRERLYDISWFMSCLNYYIALHANREDGCKSHFWEGRFISQALVDDAALLSCMAYVDLNPVRAGIANDLEHSDFTSIQHRIRQIKETAEEDKPTLMPFAENEKDKMPSAMLPSSLKGYLELVDWSGRVMRADKKGHISASTPKLLEPLKLSSEQWRVLALEIQKESVTMLNGLQKIRYIEKRKTVQIIA